MATDRELARAALAQAKAELQSQATARNELELAAKRVAHSEAGILITDAGMLGLLGAEVKRGGKWAVRNVLDGPVDLLPATAKVQAAAEHLLSLVDADEPKGGAGQTDVDTLAQLVMKLSASVDGLRAEVASLKSVV